ncbi:protein JASON-like isoform X1 [Zingiber officinale]|uniref:Protein JASON-like n=1 Tax=Zingiber officinale TaxID=94328 RepID=A0A8J5FV20_ZINOF|nr:protein JASON-like isoform X1 [Zingiber officinale]KAG6493425.1 hypothetical protein ZIOFF_048408 [Zingiber officinale]
MKCLLRCFRPEGGEVRRKNHLVSNSIPFANRADQDSLVPKRQLGTFFLDHECPPNQVQTPSSKDNAPQDSLLRELKHEAAFLKNCGALLQTPAEFHKTSGATNEAPTGDDISSNFTSKISDTLNLEILWDEKHELSRDLVQDQQNICLSQSDCISCTVVSQQTMQNCESSSLSVSSIKSVVNDEIQIDSVAELNSRCHTPDISPSRYESHIQPQASVCSSFPIPFKVTKEMETRATVYPTNLGNFATGKGTKNGNQHAYPIANPRENLRCKLLIADSLELCQSYVSDSSEKMQQKPSLTVPEELSITPELVSPSNDRRQNDHDVIYTDKHVAGKTTNNLETPYTNNRDMKALVPACPEQVVSQWLKSSIAIGVCNETKENSYSTKSSDADRPILGLVAAHWKDEAPEHRSPKQWDGNGIPNSTNKYKEDQRVSWHVTPFEERLEKALSDENFFPNRNCHHGKTLEIEDGELTDTAAS